MILILAALPTEIEIPGNTTDHKFLLTGMGYQNVKGALNDLRGIRNLNCILSVGFAGALRPSLTTGDIGLVRTVQAGPESEQFRSGRQLIEAAQNALDGDCTLVKLVSKKNGSTHPDQKAKTAQRSGADMVDMESYWVAEYAARRGIGFLGIRSVFDEWEEIVPSTNCYSWETGRVLWIPLLQWLIKHPTKVLQLIELPAKLPTARKNLSLAVGKALPKLEGALACGP